MGSMYKRGNTYWLKYYRNGKPYYESSGSTKEADAKRLLKNYHFKASPQKAKDVDGIVERLTSYPSHDFCIHFDEAKDVGLNVEELNGKDWIIVYDLHREYEKELDEVVGIIETVKGKNRVRRPKLTIW